MATKKEISDGRIFNLKPELTLAMKLAASFAITYYGLLFIYETITLCLYHYSLDSYYLGDEKDLGSMSSDLIILIGEFVFCGLLVFSLIQIFRKKRIGKAFFASATILLIIFQLIISGPFPWYKYALEIFLLLLITPIRIKKKIKVKKGKVVLEEVKEEKPEETEKDPQ